MSLILLPDAKAFLEVNYTAQDVIIQIIIDAIEEEVERFCGIGLVSATKIDVLDGGGRALWPQTRPVTSITKITQINDANDEEDIATDEFRLENDQIMRDDNFRWLAGRNRFRVTYVGGGSVPAGLKLIILAMVFRGFHNRGGKSSESAAGFSVNWQDLLTSDQQRKLRLYRAHGIVG